MERNEKGQFVKGGQETIEEKLKRAQANKEAWKQRDDYIADLVQECPRIHSSWRAMMFTEKGKKVGHAEEWSNFKTFYKDVRPTYEDGKLFRRRDNSKPFSKDNFIWLTQEEINNLQQKSLSIEFNGESHTLKDWAEIIGTTPNAIKNRYYKHQNDYTIEEILYGKRKNRGSKTPKDISEIKSDDVRAKASKMISSYNSKDVKNGFGKSDLTIEWMVENILTKPCVYCGDTYRIGCDRIDNNKGHSKNNVVPCCIECNTARNNYFTYEEMRILGKTIQEIKAKRPKKEI